MNESKLTYRHINILLDPYLHIDTGSITEAK